MFEADCIRCAFPMTAIQTASGGIPRLVTCWACSTELCTGCGWSFSKRSVDNPSVPGDVIPPTAETPIGCKLQTQLEFWTAHMTRSTCARPKHQPHVPLTVSAVGPRVDSFALLRNVKHTTSQVLAWSALVDRTIAQAMIHCPNCNALASKVSIYLYLSLLLGTSCIRLTI